MDKILFNKNHDALILDEADWESCHEYVAQDLYYNIERALNGAKAYLSNTGNFLGGLNEIVEAGAMAENKPAVEGDAFNALDEDGADCILSAIANGDTEGCLTVREALDSFEFKDGYNYAVIYFECTREGYLIRKHIITDLDQECPAGWDFDGQPFVVIEYKSNIDLDDVAYSFARNTQDLQNWQYMAVYTGEDGTRCLEYAGEDADQYFDDYAKENGYIYTENDFITEYHLKG